MAESGGDQRRVPKPGRTPSSLLTWLFVALMLIVCVGGAYGEAHPLQPDDRVLGQSVPSWPAYLLVAAAAGSLAWRNIRPWPVLLVTIVAVGSYTAFGFVNGAALLAPLVALYSVALISSLRQTVVATVITLVPLATLTAVANPFPTFHGTFPVFPVLVAVSAFGGIAVANRRDRIQAYASRAEHAERTREEEASRRVDAERLRIARELHDVVTHTMATINVQAGATIYAHPDLPPTATEALSAIKAASKRGLAELRAILSVLRQADEGEPDQPTPGLRQLDTLVATVTAAGLPTAVSVQGGVRDLPASVDLAAYRIVQESLTNALRHATPATASVSVVSVTPILRSRCRTPVGAPALANPLTGTVFAACGNAPPRSVDASRPALSSTAASGSGPSYRWRQRRDQGGARRRPGADPCRLQDAAGCDGRHRGGR
jgi:signal transduction histidine kinase